MTAIAAHGGTKVIRTMNLRWRFSSALSRSLVGNFLACLYIRCAGGLVPRGQNVSICCATRQILCRHRDGPATMQTMAPSCQRRTCQRGCPISFPSATALSGEEIPDDNTRDCGESDAYSQNIANRTQFDALRGFNFRYLYRSIGLRHYICLSNKFRLDRQNWVL
jgi:hypothetical protein